MRERQVCERRERHVRERRESARARERERETERKSARESERQRERSPFMRMPSSHGICIHTHAYTHAYTHMRTCACHTYVYLTFIRVPNMHTCTYGASVLGERADEGRGGMGENVSV